MVISHRGRKTGEKENSLEAFEKALEMGADGIECDLRFTINDKVIVSHDKISDSEYKDQLSLSDLFDYIKYKKKPFFLELKSSSPKLVKQVSEKIKKENLWDLVHLIGFSIYIKTALSFQAKYPKLRVIPFLNLPILSFIRPPKKSYGVFLGWIDEWKGSQQIFKTLISQNRLKKLKKFYNDRGFRVMAGVINNEKGIKYFKNAGITDIVTDKIKLASKILR